MFTFTHAWHSDLQYHTSNDVRQNLT